MILFVIIFYLLSVLHLPPLWKLTISLMYFALFFYLYKQTDHFLFGLEGENAVEKELKNLPSDFVVINKGLDTGRGNIDKIVLGPTGVWTLEVKNYHKNILSDKNLKQSYAEAKTLEGLINKNLGLNITAQPVLVFANKYSKVRYGLKPQRGVYVIQITWLKKLLTETHAQSLDGATVLRIKEIFKVA